MNIRPSELRSIIKHANKLGLEKTKIFDYDVKKRRFMILTEFGVREITAHVDESFIEPNTGPR
jgi:hypothetical protein